MDVLERLRALHCWSTSIGLGLSQEHMPRRLTPTLSLPESPSKRARGAASSDEEMIIDERDVPTEVIPSPSQTVVDPDPTEVIPSPSQTVVEPNPMEVSSRSPNLTVVAPDPTVSTQVSEMSPGPAVDPSLVVSALDHVEGAGRFLCENWQHFLNVVDDLRNAHLGQDRKVCQQGIFGPAKKCAYPKKMIKQ